MAQATDYGFPTSAEDATITKDASGTRLSESFDALISAHSGASRPTYAVQGTIWHDTDLAATTPLAFFDGTNDRIIPVEDANGNITISGDSIIVETQATPASASATGVKGTIVHDADYIYVCTATDTWKRVAIATW